jgi:hypothetical protein
LETGYMRNAPHARTTSGRHRAPAVRTLRSVAMLMASSFLFAGTLLAVTTSTSAAAGTPGTVAIADPAGSGVGTIGGMSCPTTTFCVGVANGSSQGIIETLSGGTWTATTAPTPTGGISVQLHDVSCPTTSWCAAAGSYTDSDDVVHTLVETYDGTDWTVASDTDPTGEAFTGMEGSEFNGIDCTSEGSCVAVGGWSPGYPYNFFLISTLQSGTWTGSTGTNPDVPVVSLNDVDCSSASHCVAVGYANTGQPSPMNSALAMEEVAANDWVMTSDLPNAEGNNASDLSGVSCPSDGNCMAVGYTELANTTGGGVYSPLAETYTGDGWQLSSTPVVPVINAELADVSCQSITSCQAVGWALQLHDHLLPGGWPLRGARLLSR